MEDEEKDKVDKEGDEEFSEVDDQLDMKMWQGDEDEEEKKKKEEEDNKDD